MRLERVVGGGASLCEGLFDGRWALDPAGFGRGVSMVEGQCVERIIIGIGTGGRAVNKDHNKNKDYNDDDDDGDAEEPSESRGPSLCRPSNMRMPSHIRLT
jgi:hypothetical protein